jgi:taurine dioxygenase
MSFRIRRLSYNLGAEVIGIDLREPLDDKSFGEVHSAFLEHSVLLFRGRPLTQEQHIAFTQRFGKIQHNRDLVNDANSQYPKIKRANAPQPNAEEWHSDLSVTLIHAMASLLRAVELPEIGGDTMFANMYLAYDTLSDGLKKLVEGLHGIHPGPKIRFDESTPERLAESKRRNPPIAQPLVRVHPETGRKALYLGEKVRQLAGMTAEESRPLLQFLIQHVTRPQFIYRHQWQKNDLVMWDNRCTNHIAVGDYDRIHIRHMERTQVMGMPSGYVYEGPLEVSYY